MNKPYYQCPVCLQAFGTIEDLHRHEQEFHNPQADREVSMQSAGGPFPCPECGEELENLDAVEEHLMRQHPARAGMGTPPI